ncbi:Protein YIP [Pyrenophora tritici-repentis]|uniref:Protein YIP n=1 Tax=Pyrenophora tritici-repentis TaxID=45151 RepID=A0A317AN05_9PLEO|nr:Protein YIP [Pyrenophora tritici-repentis]KAI1509269.1 Protein YIP [Pyrenophora tritici-repentis]KAI1527898.1 Yip1 domain containing family [Pyrenophora tritici-repentis]KAI1562809.1 Yip1 domain containing family [Pyrenophora tritici-repentis]KAI1581517.1 Yip1 domain containing family [Pyrenophora tritici-repentis]
MANRGYDVVVDVDQEGDLGHTDLQEDLEFHSSNFDTQPTPRSGGNNNSKIQPDSASASFLPGPATASTSGGGNGGGGSSRKHYLWSLNFYAQAFDVDTNEVLRRCTSTLYPRANFLDVLEGNPDLYGPVWIATTVIVILFLTGTINQYLARKGEEHFAYDFKLLSGAAGLVYGYTAFVPVGLWGVLKWYGIVNYTVVALGLAASAFFLLRNLYPVLSTTEAKTSKILLIVVLVLHAGFAIAIKVLFFAATSPVGPKTGDKGAGTGGDEAKGSMLRMLLR